jgi:hypothetical protein
MTKYSRLLTETAAHLHITTEYQGLKGGSSHIRALLFKTTTFQKFTKKAEFFCNMMMHDHITLKKKTQNSY